VWYHHIQQLHWLPIHYRIKLIIANFVFLARSSAVSSCLNSSVAQYLLFCSLRSQEACFLAVPRFKQSMVQARFASPRQPFLTCFLGTSAPVKVFRRFVSGIPPFNSSDVHPCLRFSLLFVDIVRVMKLNTYLLTWSFVGQKVDQLMKARTKSMKRKAKKIKKVVNLNQRSQGQIISKSFLVLRAFFHFGFKNSVVSYNRMPPSFSNNKTFRCFKWHFYLKKKNS